MKRLVIIVEGDAEESFVDTILAPYFTSLGIYNSIQCFKIKQSKGGISRYADVKRDIINTLYEKDVVVSTMLDFYRLPSNFPGMQQSTVSVTHLQQVELIEEKMKEDIKATLKSRYNNLIPYIQLHEFEALVFSSIDGVDELYEPSEYDRKAMLQVLAEYPNPEDINDRPDTAPSVRLKKLIPGYHKVQDGIYILKNHGMSTLLARCPHFQSWVNKLKEALRQ